MLKFATFVRTKSGTLTKLTSRKRIQSQVSRNHKAETVILCRISQRCLAISADNIGDGQMMGKMNDVAQKAIHYHPNALFVSLCGKLETNFEVFVIYTSFKTSRL
ncbi:hypothetical protein ACOME3_005937 [Neoechinorhynchus agilis]